MMPLPNIQQTPTQTKNPVGPVPDVGIAEPEERQVSHHEVAPYTSKEDSLLGPDKKYVLKTEWRVEMPRCV